MNKLILYIEELRAPFFTASIIPVLLGTAVAYHQSGIFNLFNFVLILIGSVFIHAGSNVSNDYFDSANGNDEANKEFLRPFTGGSRLIQNRLLKPKEVMIEFIVLYAAGLIIYSFLAFKIGYFVILMGAIGVLSGYFYIAPPAFLSSRGIGEILVGLNFGPLLCCSAYYVQTGTLSRVPVFASIPVAFLITAVLYINEFPDYKADKQIGKNNLVVRLGREKAVHGYLFLLLAALATVIAGVLFGILPKPSLLLLLIIPFAVVSIIELYKNYGNPSKLKIVCSFTVLMHLVGSILFILGYLL